MEKVNKYYEEVLDAIGEENESVLVFATNYLGYNIEAMDEVLYYFTGYRDLEQMEDEEYEKR